MNCNLCPRLCNINRNNQKGFCGVSNKLKIARAQLHFWEEPIISGTNGSGTIFFSGCNLKCVYCQNYQISADVFGKEVSVNRLAEIFKELENKGAHNINLVTPTHYTSQIIEALKIYKPNIPIVYNTSGYDSVKQLKQLEGYVDIFLTDFKYYSSELSFSLSNAKNYKEVATSAIKEMIRQQPKNIIENGLMKKGVIIRHMVLPNNTQDSINILKHIKENFGTDVIISLMGQYTPCYKAKQIENINRTIKPLEYKIVLKEFLNLGFKNGFSQELDSATEDYIPPFNLEGV